MRNNRPSAIAKARELRKTASQSEKVLWDHLSERKAGFRFRRQYPVHPYVLDFYCPELHLCIEVDGPHHQQRQDRDEIRDAFLAGKGISTVRISTEELHERFSVAEERIHAACLARLKEKEDRKLTFPDE